MKKKKVKKPYTTRTKVIILINLCFFLACALFYSYRLQHFYYIEHPKVKENMPIVDIVDLQNNVVTSGDGLYQEEHTYYYSGKNCSNYVQYSGMLWRIVSIDEKDSFKLICEENVTALANDTNTFEKSYMNTYLNSTFLKLIDIQEYLDTNKTWTSENNAYESKVGLLSNQEYAKAGGADSYLNNGTSYWLCDDSKYVDENGEVQSLYASHSVEGIRPVITIKGDSYALSGKGTKDKPFTLDAKPSSNLSDKYIGSYITYSGKTWRIVDKEESSVGLLCCDSVITTTFGENNYYNSTFGIGLYLNTEFYQSLEHQEYIVPHRFYIGEYDEATNYDASKLKTYDEEMYVGMPQIGDLYICGNKNGFLTTRLTSNYGDLYCTDENGNIEISQVYYERDVYPVVYLNSELVIKSGDGSKDDPFVIEE